MPRYALPTAVAGFTLSGIAGVSGVLSVSLLGLSPAFLVIAAAVAFAAGCCGVYGVMHV